MNFEETKQLGEGTVGVSCSSFKPIYWSKKDTRPTQEQVVEHNAVYKSLCHEVIKK